jgi:hypothetical protein
LELDKEKSFPLVLAGGNLTHEGSYLATLLAEKLADKYPTATILYPQVNAAVAAALLIKNRLK